MIFESSWTPHLISLRLYDLFTSYRVLMLRYWRQVRVVVHGGDVAVPADTSCYLEFLCFLFLTLSLSITFTFRFITFHLLFIFSAFPFSTLRFSWRCSLCFCPLFHIFYGGVFTHLSFSFFMSGPPRLRSLWGCVGLTVLALPSSAGRLFPMLVYT